MYQFVPTIFLELIKTKVFMNKVVFTLGKQRDITSWAEQSHTQDVIYTYSLAKFRYYSQHPIQAFAMAGSKLGNNIVMCGPYVCIYSF